MDTRDRTPLQQPMRRFTGSHERITGGLQELKELPRLAAFLARARSNAAATLALFDNVVPKHHEEEEQELFVAAQRSCSDAPECHRVRALVDQLTAQHRAIEKLWTKLRPDVALVAAGKVPLTQDFDVAARTLVDVYFAHAKLEEEDFLPLADAILSRNANHMAALDLALHMRNVPTPSAYI
jgi:hemerythrin-like domain-containing protein